MKNVATLRVGGTTYGGWEDVSITTSLENACSQFSFSSTIHDPTTTTPFKARVGAACTIFIDDTQVITGYIDEISPSHDKESHTIPVSGRSKTQDPVDCSAEPGQWTKQKVEAIAADLLRPYGVDVVTEVDTGDPVDKHVVEVGETVYESIERLCRPRKLVITDDAQGRMVLTRAGTKRAKDNLVLGENILSAEGNFNARERFSEVRCVGQRAGNDKDYGKNVAQGKGVAKDDAIERPRMLLVTAEEQADAARCQARAEWEVATRAGKSVGVTVTVAGWTQSDGSLWQKNTMTHVKDETIGLDDDLLIVEVTYHQSNDSGTITTLKLAPELGYSQLAPADQPEKKKAAAKSGTYKELENGV